MKYLSLAIITLMCIGLLFHFLKMWRDERRHRK
jgi:hypothetical protein